MEVNLMIRNQTKRSIQCSVNQFLIFSEIKLRHKASTEC